jgi:hypothetical protein
VLAAPLLPAQPAPPSHPLRVSCSLLYCCCCCGLRLRLSGCCSCCCMWDGPRCYCSCFITWSAPGLLLWAPTGCGCCGHQRVVSCTPSPIPSFVLCWTLRWRLMRGLWDSRWWKSDSGVMERGLEGGGGLNIELQGCGLRYVRRRRRLATRGGILPAVLTLPPDHYVGN